VTAPAITTASVSDVGQVRTRNEDFCDEFSHASGYRLLVVADGMGGHRAGATASRVAVEAIGEVFAGFEGPGEAPPEEMLELALLTANRRVYQMAVDDPELRGMGTTAVALLLAPDESGWVAHIGDSRAYRYREGLLEPLTADHSVVGEMERRGLITAEEAAIHPRRNEIMRCVGVQAEVQADIMKIDVRLGDRYVLCSDGLSGLVSDQHIAAVVAEAAPAEAAQQLVEAANRHGGHDNVTVQIASIHLPGELAAGHGPSTRVDTATETSSGLLIPIELPLPSATGSADPLRQRAARSLLVVSAVMLAGLAALTLLWKVYEMNAPSAATISETTPATAEARPATAR
jgi:protein phosphatase